MSETFQSFVYRHAKNAGYGKEAAQNELHINGKRLSNPIDLKLGEIIAIRDKFFVPDRQFEEWVLKIIREGKTHG